MSPHGRPKDESTAALRAEVSSTLAPGRTKNESTTALCAKVSR